MWKTQNSSGGGKNLQWLESFNLIIDNETDITVDVIMSDGETGEDCVVGTASIKVKHIKQGQSSNKIPILNNVCPAGYLYFQTDYTIPLCGSSISLDESCRQMN